MDGWRVSDYSTFSDHNRIDFKLCKGKKNTRMSRNLRKASWSRYQLEVESYFNEFPIPDEWDIDEIEAQVAHLETAITQGLDVVAPLTPHTIRDRSPINNPEIIRAEKECHRLKGKLKRKENSEELLNQYREARNTKKYAWKRISKKKYTGYVSEIPDPKGAARLIRSVKKDGFVPPTLMKHDGQYTSTKKETIEVLMNTHFPGSVEAQPELSKQMEDIVRGDKPKQKIEPVKWINTDTVRRAIGSFMDHKASGPDGLKPIVLKNLPDVAIIRLTEILTACLTLGYTPLSWRTSRTVFIPKPSREDYTIPKSFRPISLTSFCFKTLERLVLWHLEQTTFRRKPLHAKQHAFRKGHSCEVALSQVTDRIEKSIYNNKVVMAAFLDIEGAFDNLDTNAAVKAMKDHGIEKTIITWYEHYLRNRISSVQYGERTSQRALTRGTPQGGVLSPILWNLAFDSLLKRFDTGMVEIFGYADDACLLTASTNPEITRRRMQEAIDKCTKWGDKQGLRFSPKKTVIVMFRRRVTNINPGGKLSMYGQEIEYSSSVRYLGVQFDCRLNWNAHFQKKISNAKSLLFKMRNAMGITWGLQPKLLRWVYTGIVRPAITYGSIVWSHSIKHDEQLKKLRRLHGTILRMMCPKRRSTPVAGMEIMFYVPPLELVIKGEAIKAHMRNIHMLPHDWSGLNLKGQVGHVWANWDLCKQFDVPDMEWDREAAKLHFNNNYVVEEDSYEKGLDVDWEDAIFAYTDGSLIKENPKDSDTSDDESVASNDVNKSNNEKVTHVGCGYVIMESNKDFEKEEVDYGCFHLQEHHSVYQAETTAMHKAATHLLRSRRGERRRRIFLLTDSKSLVQSLNRHLQDKKTVNSLVATLNLLGAYHDVRIRWVKAHAQCAGNNRADEIAKLGADTAKADEAGIDYEEITDLPAPYSYLRKRVQDGIHQLWKEKWTAERYSDGRPKYRQTKHWFPEPNKNKSYDIIRNDRQTIGKLMQFVTGHAHMNRHQNLVDTAAAERNDEDIEVASPQCRFCSKGEETPYHLVLECEETAEDSRRYLKDQPPERDKINVKFNWSVHKLIQFLASSTLDPLFGIEEQDTDTNSVTNPEDVPLPESADEENQDGDITMKDLWNRPLSRSL